MAVINTLRNKLGKFIVAAVAIAIMSFVLADLLGPNSSLFGGGNEVGEIAGQSVSLKEFQAAVQERETSYILNFNRQPTEKERPTLRQQAWELLIVKYAFNQQYEEVGVVVTEEELWDMVQGKNIDPSLQQSFTNPETGQFDRQRLMAYINQLPSMNPNAQAQWEMYINELRNGRRRLKYENLLTKTNYVTTAEAKMEYNAQNDVAEVKYLYVPYFSVSDSLITVTDSDIEDYYSENKDRYKVEASRAIEYIAFDIVASSADTAFVKDELMQLKEQFAKADNDSVFASLNSDDLVAYGIYHAGDLPLQLKANISNLTKGDVRGPYLDAEGFKMYKVSDIYEDSVSYAKASHILFKGDDAEAKASAQDVLNQIKNGADFAAMAREHGTDGTASRGGDLGWFSTGKMVEEFEKAVFGAAEKGLLPNLVKTQFGYHIVKVDEVKTNTGFKVATILRNILPGDETINESFTRADVFKTAVDDLESFREVAAQDSLYIQKAPKIAANDRTIVNLGEARSVVQWLFTNASEGDVSDVYELDDAYVVAVMTGEVEKGYKSVDDAKTEIYMTLKNQKKGDKIIEKLSTLAGSLDEKATAYGADANIYTNSSLMLSATSLQSVGFDPKAIGVAFALETGEVSKPFKGENGVLIMETQNKTVAPEIADYATYKTQLQQQVNNQVAYGISEAIKKSANIEDERYKFY